MAPRGAGRPAPPAAPNRRPANRTGQELRPTARNRRGAGRFRATVVYCAPRPVSMVRTVWNMM